MKKEALVVSPTAATFYFYKFFWSVLPSRALETPQLGFCEQKRLQILLNLTWLCTKASRNLLRNLLRNPVEPDLAPHQSLLDSRPSPEPSSEPCWTWPGSAPKPPRPSPEPSPEPCWTWFGFAPRLPGTFSGTFGAQSGTLLNLTWLCTKASQTFTGTFSGTFLNVTWLCTKAS